MIPTEWFLHQEGFDQICSRLHSLSFDRLVCHQIPQQTPRICVLSLLWEVLDLYVFPPVALLGKVASKIMDHNYQRVILIAPGWPNMPWFWNLVMLLTWIPLGLLLQQDLLTPPFSGEHSHRSPKPEPPHFDTRISSIKEQGFSEVATRGHGGRVVTLSPPTSEAGVRSPSRPQVGKLVVACHWSAVYSTQT